MQPQTASTKARRAYADYQMYVWPREAEVEARLREAAEAEELTDAPYLIRTADWLERMASQHEEAGKTFSAEENRAQAAYFRRVAADLMRVAA